MTTSDWTTQLPVITDGAWGTELQARGLGVGDFPDAWNLTHPEKVREVALAYVQAGSKIILTNTFGANRPRLAGHDMAKEAVALNRAGVQISREAAAGRALVYASVGPSGKMLLSGDITPEELRTGFDEQCQALAAAGADGLVIETMGDLEEARIAVAAARATGLKTVACMVFDAGRDKDRTMMGNTPEQVAESLREAGADIIGANCGQGIAGYIPVCRRLRAAAGAPVWIKANAGLPVMVEGKVTYRTSPEEFASHFQALLDAGAGFVGGCCGTNPAFIRALTAHLAGGKAG
jgi:methionine synthase I (cobalamin-dependent)